MTVNKDLIQKDLNFSVITKLKNKELFYKIN